MQVIIPFLHPFTDGGGLFSVRELIRACSPDVKFVTITQYGSQTSVAFALAGAEVIGLQEPLSLSLRHPSLYRRTCRELLHALCDLWTNDSLIITQGVGEELCIGPSCLGRLFPRVYFHRGNEYVPHVAGRLSWSLSTAAAVACASRYQVKTIAPILRLTARARVSLGPPRLFLLPNLVSPPVTKGQIPTWVDPDKVYVGLVGYLDQNKNQALLVEAARIIAPRLPRVKFVLVGRPIGEIRGRQLGGDYRYYLHVRRLISTYRLEDRFVLLPFTDKVADIYSALHIVVSTSRKEGFGRTVAEAMAYGRPVVVCKGSGPEELVAAGRNGLLFACDDANSLASALEVLISDDALRQQYGRAAKRLSRAYLPSGLKSRYIAAFESICHTVAERRNKAERLK